MNREIKFRAWDKECNLMREVLRYTPRTGHVLLSLTNGKDYEPSKVVLMQFTGLKDMNGLQDLYEGDIVDIEGSITGNIYENDKREADLVIQGFGTKDWIATYKEAVDRGCKDAE